MSVKAVRGAVSINSDTVENITGSVTELIEKLAEVNRLKAKKIISIQFTMTDDIKSINAAAALRKGTNRFNNTPLFVSSEPMVDNSLPSIVRVLITYQQFGKKHPSTVYLGDAASLRPDLVQK